MDLLTYLLTGTLRISESSRLRWSSTGSIYSVAPLTLVSPGAVTDGVTLYFPPKSDDILVIVTIPTLSAFQVIVYPLLFVNSAAKILSFGCHPLTGGGPSPPPPSPDSPYFSQCIYYCTDPQYGTVCRQLCVTVASR